jgi:DNA invertase Pin-like site-specific DNA recombinase
MVSISEFERELIHARMTEGRKRARANGVKFGPKFKLNPFQRQEALARLAAGETQSAACMPESLVGGEGFAVDGDYHIIY